MTTEALEGRARVRQLAWPLGALGLLISATTATLAFMNRSAIHSVDGADPVEVILPIGFAVMGALLASRRPRNPIGWIFLGIAIFTGLPGIATQYALRSSHIHRLPFVTWVAWAHDWLSWLVFPTGLAFFFFLLFPDGRFQSHRWPLLAWVGGGFLALGVVLIMMQDTIKLTGSPAIRNPIGVRGVNMNAGIAGDVWQGAFFVLIIAMVGTILRTRRSTGEVRQQLGWLAYATGATIGGLVAMVVAGSIDPHISSAWWDLVIVLGFGVAVPVSCGVAILKYRLYEIDRIINRTLVYGGLTVVLGALYIGLAVGLGSLVRSNNSLVIAGSTLVVAALFRPARRRVQAFIDRRFYRRKYDAQRTLQAFTASLRDEVDLDELSGHLVGVVQENMQPAHVSLWLRTAERPV